MIDEQKAPRAFTSLRDRAKKLTDWYVKNKPSVDVVRVTDEEYQALKQFPAIASSCGFHINGGDIVLNGFRVLPTHAPTSFPAPSEKP
jgi:hypothetical protein